MTETLGREMDGISDLGHRDRLAYPFAQHLNGTLYPLIERPSLPGSGQGETCNDCAGTGSEFFISGVCTISRGQCRSLVGEGIRS